MTKTKYAMYNVWCSRLHRSLRYRFAFADMQGLAFYSYVEKNLYDCLILTKRRSSCKKPENWAVMCLRGSALDFASFYALFPENCSFGVKELSHTPSIIFLLNFRIVPTVWYFFLLHVIDIILCRFCKSPLQLSRYKVASIYISVISILSSIFW